MQLLLYTKHHCHQLYQCSIRMTFSKSNCLVVRKAGSGPTDVLDDFKSKLFSLLDSQNFRRRPSKNTFLLNFILCLDFIFDLVFGFHGCSIKYLGVWMVSRDGCLKVAGSHKHSTAVVLVSKRKVVWYKQPDPSIWVKPK